MAVLSQSLCARMHCSTHDVTVHMGRSISSNVSLQNISWRDIEKMVPRLQQGKLAQFVVQACPVTARAVRRAEPRCTFHEAIAWQL